jgi:hypothetical protein
MTMRRRKKQFWWTWHCDNPRHAYNQYVSFGWGVGRIKHQHPDCIKDRRLG